MVIVVVHSAQTGHATVLVCIVCQHLTAVFWLVVQKLRRESAHAHNFQFKIPIKSARMRGRGFSSQFLDNQPENRCTWLASAV